MAEHSTVARPYARAVFAIAQASDSLAAFSQLLHAAAEVVADARANEFLANPALRPGERAEFVTSIVARTAASEAAASTHGRNLFAVLSENGRLGALPEIAARFDKLKAAAENKLDVRLVTASAVDRGQVEKIAQALQRRLGRTVEVEVEQRPELVGGAIVRADDRVIDGSVKSRLQRLAASLVR